MFLGDLVLIAFLSLHAYRDGTSILYPGKKQKIIQLTIAQWTRSTISKSLSSAALQTPLLMMNKNVYLFVRWYSSATYYDPDTLLASSWLLAPKNRLLQFGKFDCTVSIYTRTQFLCYTIYCVVSLWLVLPLMYYDCGLSSTDVKYNTNNMRNMNEWLNGCFLLQRYQLGLFFLFDEGENSHSCSFIMYCFFLSI